MAQISSVIFPCVSSGKYTKQIFNKPNKNVLWKHIPGLNPFCSSFKEALREAFWASTDYHGNPYAQPLDPDTALRFPRDVLLVLGNFLCLLVKPIEKIIYKRTSHEVWGDFKKEQKEWLKETHGGWGIKKIFNILMAGSAMRKWDKDSLFWGETMDLVNSYCFLDSESMDVDWRPCRRRGQTVAQLSICHFTGDSYERMTGIVEDWEKEHTKEDAAKILCCMDKYWERWLLKHKKK